MLRQLRPQIALALVGAVAIGLLLVAFSNRAFEDRPARGGDLVEAVIGRPAVFNPLFATTDAELDVVRLTFSGLTRPGPDGAMRPDLASSWSVSGNARTYTFRLRDGAVWHDGEPVTADDVVFTAALARQIANDPRLAVGASHLVKAWAQVTATRTDDQTVTLNLAEPYAPFLDSTALGILPAHLLADVPAEALANHRYSRLEPIGSGPYRIDLPGGVDAESVRLVRFDQHWEASARRPYLERLVFRYYADAASAVAALGEREVQAMGGVPPTALASLGEDIRLYLAQQPGYALVYLNTANVLFADPDVRRALSLAVDRPGLIQEPTILDGLGVAAAGPVSPASWAYEGSQPVGPGDPAAAAALLERQGWVDSDGDGVRDREGKALRFGLGARDDPVSLAVAARVRDDWKRLGVDAEVEPMNQTATVGTLTGRDFDAMLFSWDLRQYDPDPYPLWHSSQAAEGQNYGGYASPDADRFLAEARRLPPDDVTARAEAYRGFLAQFATDQPALVLYHPVYAYAVADPGLGGVQLPPLLVEAADRFMNLSDWYVRTERVFLNR